MTRLVGFIDPALIRLERGAVVGLVALVAARNVAVSEAFEEILDAQFDLLRGRDDLGLFLVAFRLENATQDLGLILQIRLQVLEDFSIHMRRQIVAIHIRPFEHIACISELEGGFLDVLQVNPRNALFHLLFHISIRLRQQTIF